jgi:malonate transporter
MTSVFLALLPVFVVILAGYALRRYSIIPEAQWHGIDQLCYFVLFPAIIFKEIAIADFTSVPVLEMAAAMVASVIVMVGLLVLLNRPIMRLLQISPAQFTSLVQGAARWHTFIAFAIVPLQFGPSALPLAAVGAATMTPALNILCVVVMVQFIGQSSVSARRLATSIIQNPFVLSSLGGVAWQVTGLEIPSVPFTALNMVGGGALGLALLTVGAGLRISDALPHWPTLLVAVVLKLLFMPVLVGTALMVLGVRGDAFSVALLCAAVPTGSGAYVLARQMGGDAPMVANILTLQVVASAVTIPVVLYLADALS